VIYSLVLFYLLKKYYDRIKKDYDVLMKGVQRIAEGDLDTVITEDIGVFEPFKEQLTQIRTGFKKAVEDEVKSQRMKTELITNVSHDLKTPLTAITTYVELLKKEDITEEERKSYIETLEKKSLRLKVLIEDLFEVSKASTNNITLNLMDVDVVNLMKQVSVEHTDKFEQLGLKLRWNVPEEKIILKLDNQKTYRIFENLFVNIQKYAMPDSRVYIDVERIKNQVVITMRNMSAVELHVKGEELTERFVRGDASRNTEGSGLGLAIAKSFTEAQKGSLNISVDGDLFKVVIVWK
jgi:K+-sensing histidine kinase KdpD